ncbi:hypothetical protein [Aeromonas molluscorum]|uniref:DNA polymerase III subunit psi n=1 Tax=Aeromonas molluscorum 848 TaxID=1268236 RepID=R1F8C9_9GAMM|nr:hypothetical protein [Aeromonas molluscorum]EOD55993.1 hypothetical protein G113_05844 [Aeromonas molluscorum 848]
MLDPLRQGLLSRMGIQEWQVRRPALLGAEPVPPPMPGTAEAAASSQPSPYLADPLPATQSSHAKHALPAGRLWIVADRLPAPTLLADVCLLLGFSPQEVSLVPSLTPGMVTPLLWLEEVDPAWPQALICPLQPSAAQKRALWQQLRQRLT